MKTICWFVAQARIPIIGLALATSSLFMMNGLLRCLAKREVVSSLCMSQDGKMLALPADVVSSSGGLSEDAFKARVARASEDAPPLPADLHKLVFVEQVSPEVSAAVVSSVFSPSLLGPFDASFAACLPLEGTAKPSDFSDAVLSSLDPESELDEDSRAATARYLDAVYRELSARAFWTFAGHRWVNGFVQVWTFWLFFWASWLLLERYVRNVLHEAEAWIYPPGERPRRIVPADVDLARARLDTTTGSLVYLAWAIPSVGFIGTILGIGQALENADRMLVTDVVEQQRAIQQVTGLLGTAFDTTLIGLLLSLVLMLAFYLIRGAEDERVIQVATSTAERAPPTLNKDLVDEGQRCRLNAVAWVALALVLLLSPLLGGLSPLLRGAMIVILPILTLGNVRRVRPAAPELHQGHFDLLVAVVVLYLLLAAVLVLR